MIDHNKQKLNSAEIIFMAVMANPKQRFEFSRPVYLPYASKRESRVSGQTSYMPSILIRARQGHTASSSPTAGMVKLDESNLPVVALHGTSVAAMKGIMKHGLTPGGETAENRGTGRQAVHLAATLPASDAEVVSGYRQGSQVCINVDLAAFLENGGEVWQSANFVLNIFTTIRPAFFLCAVDTTNGWDYVTSADASALWVAKLNPVFTSTFRAHYEEQSISRERVSFLSPDDLPDSLVSLKQEAESAEEGDRDFIDPVSRPKKRVHFEDDEPEPAMSGKTAENIRTVLESALGQNLDDLKTTARDPSDVQQGLDQAAAKAELEAKSRVSESPLDDPQAAATAELQTVSRVSELSAGDFLEPDEESEEDEELQQAIRLSRQQAQEDRDREPEQTGGSSSGGTTAPTQWKPTLRQDKSTGEPVLVLKEEKKKTQRRWTRSPTPDTSKGDHTRVTIPLSSGYREYSIWVANTTFEFLKNLNPDTLYEKVRRELGLVREVARVPQQTLDEKEKIEAGEVPRVRTVRPSLQQEKGIRFDAPLPIIRPARPDLSAEGLHYKSTIQTGQTEWRMK